MGFAIFLFDFISSVSPKNTDTIYASSCPPSCHVSPPHEMLGDISYPCVLFSPQLWRQIRFMGPIWGRQVPGGPHVGPMNFAIWVVIWNLWGHWLQNLRMCYTTLVTQFPSLLLSFQRVKRYPMVSPLISIPLPCGVLSMVCGNCLLFMGHKLSFLYKVTSLLTVYSNCFLKADKRFELLHC